MPPLQEIAELAEVILSSGDDGEMRKLASEEHADLSARLEDSCEGLALLLVPEDPSDERDAILEARRHTPGGPRH